MTNLDNDANDDDDDGDEDDDEDHHRQHHEDGQDLALQDWETQERSRGQSYACQGV